MGKPITFVDRNGNTMHMDGDLTIADLAKLGIEAKLAPKGVKLPMGWWRDVGPSKRKAK